MKAEISIPFQSKTLQCEFVIIEYDEDPILMVMRDDFGNLFLNLCSEIRGMNRWIVAPTSLDTLHHLINFDLTINDALRAVSRFAYVIERHGQDYSISKVAFRDIPPRFLAKEGVYADFMEYDCDENLAKLEQEANANAEEYFVSSYDEVLLSGQTVFYPEENDSKPGRQEKPVQDYSVPGNIQSKYSIHVHGQSDAYHNDGNEGFAA